jgi:hypothetical protein
MPCSRRRNRWVKDFEAARSSLRKAYSTLEHNRLLLEVNTRHEISINQKKTQSMSREGYTAQMAIDKQIEADKMTKISVPKWIQRSQRSGTI